MPNNEKKYYFTEETEKAIIEFNNEKDIAKKNRIFEEKINYPFHKLSENIINRWRTYYFDLPPNEVKKEVVSFLLTKIDKYHPEKGKAFSYFSVVARNYLWLNNNNNYKYRKMHQSIDSFTEEQENFQMAEIFKRMDKNVNEELRNDLQQILDKTSTYIEENLDFLFKKERDKKIALAIIEILKNHEQIIESYHKKALYLVIREYSGEKTIYITKVINKIKKHYKDIYHEHFDNKWDLQNL